MMSSPDRQRFRPSSRRSLHPQELSLSSIAPVHSPSSQTSSRRSGAMVVPPNASVAQLSFAPATKTTVVTTTTTTTTSLPPFLIKAPSRDLDPDQYPLANSPTPASLRKLEFKAGGQNILFEAEEDHPEDAYNDYHERTQKLRDSNGILKSRRTSYGTNGSGRHRRLVAPTLQDPVEDEQIKGASATPASTTDAAELQSFHRRNGRPSRHSPRRPHPLNQSFSTFGDVENPYSTPAHRSSVTPTRAQVAQDQQRLSDDEDHAAPASGQESPSADSDADPFSTFKAPEIRRRSVAPRSIDTTPPQDTSLPSPSLSPTTAAANLHRSQPIGEYRSIFGKPAAHEDDAATDSGDDTADTEQNGMTLAESNQPAPFMSVGSMLESFETLPDQMKNWMIYHMLKRCSKHTLHFVSEVVAPTLKCDFLGRLPVEIGSQVVGLLDVQSLCNAAQVNKNWRRIVDGNEAAWLALIKSYGFTVRPREIERAISEGWGWQFPREGDDFDINLNEDETLLKNGLRRLSTSSDPGTGSSTSSARKRKAPSRHALSSKRRKQLSGVARLVEEHYDPRAGPYAASDAARLVHADVTFGLPHLRNMHLFKSIFRRHYTIRKNWMNPDKEPQHTAFRAHERHVVTCLQFDSEKILTGSDDANIDIYDTRTGASLQRLQGHDGGVWALEYYGDILVSGSTDRTVRIWNMKSGRQLHVFQGHTSTVRCLQILRPVEVGRTADGRPIMMPKQPLIITGSRDSTCRIWRLPDPDDEPFHQSGNSTHETFNPYLIKVLTGHTNSVRAIAAHADILISGSYDASVRVWKISTGELVHKLEGHTSKVYSVVLDHKRKQCISGSMDNYVIIWSTETGEALHKLEGHSSLVGLLDLKDDYLVSAAADATLRIWDPATGKCRHRLTAHSGAITCFSHDGQKIISGSDQTLKMWNTQSGECVRDLLTGLTGVWQIKFDDRRCVAAVQRNRWTYIEVLDFGAPRDALRGHRRGERIVVDEHGEEITEEHTLLNDHGPGAGPAPPVAPAPAAVPAPAAPAPNTHS